jgi:tmRNA-binding protein
VEILKLAGNFKGKMNDLDRIVKLSQGLMCLGMTAATLLSNPTNLFKAVGFIAATAGNLIANAVADRLSRRVGDLTRTVSAPLKLIGSYLKSIQNIFDNLESAYNKIKNKKGDLKDFLFNTQNCAIQAGNFLNCVSAIIAKKVTKKVLLKIDTEFDKIQKEVSASVYTAGGILEQSAGRQIRQAETLSRQLNAML